MPETAVDRTARYTARLDAHLATFSTDRARLQFLIAEQDKWLERERRFRERIAAGREPEFGETAWDYALTLAEIGIRKGRYAAKEAA